MVARILMSAVPRLVSTLGLSRKCSSRRVSTLQAKSLRHQNLVSISSATATSGLPVRTLAATINSCACSGVRPYAEISAASAALAANNSSSRRSPSGQSPCPESTLIWPAFPALTSSLPHARATRTAVGYEM